MNKIKTNKLMTKISKTRKHSVEYNELIKEFNDRVAELEPIETISINPEFVTCDTIAGVAYAWKVNLEGLLIIENTRAECVDSFQEAYWLEYDKNINVILEERN